MLVSGAGRLAWVAAIEAASTLMSIIQRVFVQIVDANTAASGLGERSEAE